jgi:hypothetical protein
MLKAETMSTKHNEQVKKNRVILRRFIAVMCPLAKQIFPLWGHDGLPTSLNDRHFVEFLNVLKNYGLLFENYLNSANVIEFQIKILSLFHEICYFRIQ